MKGAADLNTMTKKAKLIFPHQLLANHPLLSEGGDIYLIEEYLFFNQYKFHKQKIAFHRASMKGYEAYLQEKGIQVNYIDANSQLSDVRQLIPHLEEKGFTEIHFVDPVDNWLSKHIKTATKNSELKSCDSPLFLNSANALTHFFKPQKKSFFQTTFYKQERKKRTILVDEQQNPEGGKWTFDTENRKKYPKGKTPPAIHYPNTNSYWSEAFDYVHNNYSNNYGEVDKNPLYPINFEQAEVWFRQFLEFRFHQFGDYEDAIVKEESFLHHSILSPLLNCGLLTPDYIVNESLSFAKSEGVPINSAEGFVRQIIGWREFIRGMYVCKGNYARTRNYWQFTRKIPVSFYKGTTGIDPVDDTIKKVLRTGYCHHIERLMILGNFMLLCEFDPDEVYKWFMELFIDAYDWVMVPNIYGMSQFADGGTFATKPYIGGSNYIKKMSNYKTGEWATIWDGLFWRFISTHQDFFSSNPRMGMMVHSFNRMETEKQAAHIKTAETFLSKFC